MTKELNKINIKEKTYFATPAPEFFSCQGCSFLHNRIECDKVKQLRGCYSNDRTTRLIWVEESQHEKQSTQNERGPSPPLINHILWAMAGGIITDEEGIWLYRLRGIDSMGYCCGWIALLDGINCENTTLHIAEARMATEQECRRGGASYLPDTEKRAKQKTSEPSDDPRATFFYPMDARIIHGDC